MFGGCCGTKPSYIKGISSKVENKKIEISYTKEEKVQVKNKVHIDFQGKLRVGKRVFETKELAVGYDKPLISDIEFSFFGGDKLAIMGDNGSGKTTFIKTLLGKIKPYSGKICFYDNFNIGYLPQDGLLIRSNKTVLDYFRDLFPLLTLQEVYNTLGAFDFSREDDEKIVDNLSGGEKMRLVLSTLVEQKYDILVLDEPTNHMDIVGKEALEQMLKSYTGTVLFVSHDRYFIKEIATGILDFQADKVQYYLCTYEEYLEQKQKEAQGLIGGNKTNAAGNSGKSRNVAGEAADNRNISQVGSQSNPPTLSDVFDKKTYYNPGKIISRLKQQLVKYEKMLGESEERLAELQMQQMDTALATDYEKLTELEQAIAAEQSNQESILDRLVETETELDEMQEKTV